MQKSNLAERNLNPQYVQSNSKTYNWPYSQPRLVNAVHATSRIGILFGVLSSLLMLNDGYLNNGWLVIDFFLTLSFIVLRCGIVPMIRRATIKEVASESRKLNKIGLISLCIIMYTGMTRFLGAMAIYLINNSWDFKGLFILALQSITIPILIVGIILVILPSVLLLYPKDIAIKEYHYKVKNLTNQIPDIPITEDAQNTQYVQTSKRMPNMAPATYNGSAYKPYTKPASRVQTDTQRTPKKESNNHTKNKNQNSQQKKQNVSVWDSDKSVRKPRK